MPAATFPLSRGEPQFVEEQPFRCPRNDGVGDRHSLIPFFGTGIEQAQYRFAVGVVYMRDIVVTVTLAQRRIDDDNFGKPTMRRDFATADVVSVQVEDPHFVVEIGPTQRALPAHAPRAAE